MRGCSVDIVMYPDAIHRALWLSLSVTQIDTGMCTVFLDKETWTYSLLLRMHHACVFSFWSFARQCITLLCGKER